MGLFLSSQFISARAEGSCDKNKNRPFFKRRPAKLNRLQVHHVMVSLTNHASGRLTRLNFALQSFGVASFLRRFL